MPRIFFLASSLGPTGPAKLLSMLAPALPREHFTIAVGVAGPIAGPYAAPLKAAGVELLSLPIRHPMDVNGLWGLRDAIARFNPDVLHVLGSQAATLARFLAFPKIGLRPMPAVIVSAADRPDDGVAGWLARLAVRSATQVIAPTAAEGERYRNLGVPTERVLVVPPGIGEPPKKTVDPKAFRRSLGIPKTSRIVIATGLFDAVAGLRSAVWAFDVVKYVATDLYLVLVGDGPERERLERFGKALGFDDYRTRFAGIRADVPSLVRLAEVVWVTHERGGTNVALEAMVAGVPVVAVRTADLAEVVEDRVTGRLVSPADRVELAAVTNELLEDPTLARAYGDAGRERAIARFPVSLMAERFGRIYDDVLSRRVAAA